MKNITQAKKWLLLLLTIMVLPVSAQQSKGPRLKKAAEPAIHLIAKAYGDSVVLRWGPQSPALWAALNISGYAVRRTSFVKNNKSVTMLSQQPVKPWTLDVMKARLAKDSMAAIAAQALYGKNFGAKPAAGTSANVLAQSNEEEIRFTFLMLAADWDANVAEAAGLRWVDKNIIPGEYYVYEVFPFTPFKDAATDTGAVAILNKPDKENKRPMGLEVTTGDKHLTLTWPRPEVHTYGGYYIEKSSDGGRTFHRLNSKPYLPPQESLTAERAKKTGGVDLNRYYMYTDTLHENYKTYMYRVAGINSFGETSAFSDTAAGTGRDLAPPSKAQLLPAIRLGGQSVKLSWIKKTMEPDLAGYYVSRSRNNKKYELLTPTLLHKNETTFIDHSAYVHGPNYYYITTVDTAGNYSVSEPVVVSLPDSTPPAAPHGLRGKVDKDGSIAITWAANTEEDLRGYMIYYSNSDKHIFIPRVNRNLPKPVFYDTIPLKTLSRHIYYRVKAADTHGNFSAFSEILDLSKPDIDPPAPPVIASLLVRNKKVSMQIVGSSSEDAAKYIIYRKVKDKDKEWTMLTSIKHNPNSQRFTFIDSSIRANVTYLYTVDAVDNDNLHSAKCASKQAMYYSKHHEALLSPLTARYNSKDNTIKLQWKYKATGDYVFNVYRSTGGEMQQLQSVPVTGELNSFTDYKLDKSIHIYRYYVSAEFKDKRGEATLGEPATVSIK